MLCRAGWKVLVVEQSDVPGGASKSRELTLPGFVHDVCATNIGFFLGSDTFQEFKDDFFANGFGISAGDQPYASVFPDGDAVCGYMEPQRMVDELARQNPTDAEAWTHLLQEFGRFSGHLLTIYKLPMPSFALVRHAYSVYRSLGRAEFWDLVQILLASSQNFVDARFQSEKVKALFTPWGFHLDHGPDVSGGAAFPYLEVPLDYPGGTRQGGRRRARGRHPAQCRQGRHRQRDPAEAVRFVGRGAGGAVLVHEESAGFPLRGGDQGKTCLGGTRLVVSRHGYSKRNCCLK